MPIGQAKFGLLGGIASISDSLEKIETQTLSDDTAIDFDSLGTGYKAHLFICNNIHMDDNRDQNIRAKVGGSVDSTNDYFRAFENQFTNNNWYEDRDATLNRLRINSEVGGFSPECWNAYIYMYNALSSTQYTFFTQSNNVIGHDGSLGNRYGAGGYLETDALSGVQFFPSSGFMRSGTITLYGIRNS